MIAPEGMCSERGMKMNENKAMMLSVGFAVLAAGLGFVHLASRTAAAAAASEGISEVTTTNEGGVPVENVNTMPCINAAAAAAVSSARSHYIPDAAANASRIAAYKKKAGTILTGNRLFNRELSRVCSELVVAAKRVTQAK